MQTKVTMLPLPIFGCWKKRDGGKKKSRVHDADFPKNPFCFYESARRCRCRKKQPTPTVTKYAASRWSCFWIIYMFAYRMILNLHLSLEKGVVLNWGGHHFFRSLPHSLRYTIVENIFVEHCRNHWFCWTHNRWDRFEGIVFTEGPIAVIHTSFCLRFHAYAIHFAG